MSADGLIERFRLRGVELRADGMKLRYSAPAGVLTAADKAELAAHKAALLAVLSCPPAVFRPALGATYTRRRKASSVVRALEHDPALRFAVEVANGDSDPVVLAVAIRDAGTCELLIPKDRYDPFAIIALIEANFGGADLH